MAKKQTISEKIATGIGTLTAILVGLVLVLGLGVVVKYLFGLLF